MIGVGFHRTSLIITLLLGLAGTGVAAESPRTPPSTSPSPSPSEQALTGLDLLMKALEGWMRRFPVYSAPEILPNGDIIIRRRPVDPPPRPSTGGTETET